jgi:hypothetical protein
MSPPDWQPIDTAPSETEILVYTRQWGAIIARHSEEHGEWLSRMQVPVSLTDESDTPTHWQALPEPPDGIERDEDGRGVDERTPDRVALT